MNTKTKYPTKEAANLARVRKDMAKLKTDKGRFAMAKRFIDQHHIKDAPMDLADPVDYMWDPKIERIVERHTADHKQKVSANVKPKQVKVTEAAPQVPDAVADVADIDTGVKTKAVRKSSGRHLLFQFTRLCNNLATYRGEAILYTAMLKHCPDVRMQAEALVDEMVLDIYDHYTNLKPRAALSLTAQDHVIGDVIKVESADHLTTITGMHPDEWLIHVINMHPELRERMIAAFGTTRMLAVFELALVKAAAAQVPDEPIKKEPIVPTPTPVLDPNPVIVAAESLRSPYIRALYLHVNTSRIDLTKLSKSMQFNYNSFKQLSRQSAISPRTVVIAAADIIHMQNHPLFVDDQHFDMAAFEVGVHQRWPQFTCDVPAKCLSDSASNAARAMSLLFAVPLNVIDRALILNKVAEALSVDTRALTPYIYNAPGDVVDDSDLGAYSRVERGLTLIREALKFQMTGDCRAELVVSMLEKFKISKADTSDDLNQLAASYFGNSANVSSTNTYETAEPALPPQFANGNGWPFDHKSKETVAFNDLALFDFFVTKFDGDRLNGIKIGKNKALLGLETVISVAGSVDIVNMNDVDHTVFKARLDATHRVARISRK